MNEDQIKKMNKLIKYLFDQELFAQESYPFLFRLYKLYYKRKYKDDVENEERYKIFVKNMDLVNEKNSQKKSFKLGINKFTDRLNNEVPLGLIPTPNPEPKPQQYMSDAGPKTSSINSKVSPVIKQQYTSLPKPLMTPLGSKNIPKSKDQPKTLPVLLSAEDTSKKQPSAQNPPKIVPVLLKSEDSPNEKSSSLTPDEPYKFDNSIFKHYLKKSIVPINKSSVSIRPSSVSIKNNIRPSLNKTNKTIKITNYEKSNFLKYIH